MISKLFENGICTGFDMKCINNGDCNSCKTLIEYANQQPQLDSEVKKLIAFIEIHYGTRAGSCIDKEPAWLELKQAFITQQIQINNQKQRIKDLNDTLEITVISEMLDLIKNGKPIPPTRKELQAIIKEYFELEDEILTGKAPNNCKYEDWERYRELEKKLRDKL